MWGIGKGSIFNSYLFVSPLLRVFRVKLYLERGSALEHLLEAFSASLSPLFDNRSSENWVRNFFFSSFVFGLLLTVALFGLNFRLRSAPLEHVWEPRDETERDDTFRATRTRPIKGSRRDVNWRTDCNKSDNIPRYIFLKATLASRPRRKINFLQTQTKVEPAHSWKNLSTEPKNFSRSGFFVRERYTKSVLVPCRNWLRFTAIKLKW